METINMVVNTDILIIARVQPLHQEILKFLNWFHHATNTKTLLYSELSGSRNKREIIT